MISGKSSHGNSREVVRLSRTESVSRFPISGWGAALFGTPFILMGVFLILAMADVIPIDEGSIHAPRWVINVAGWELEIQGDVPGIDFQARYLLPIYRKDMQWPAQLDDPASAEHASSEAARRT